ncbi:TBC1 domain, member 5 [Rhizophlyctis rosea]|uniref:TBC1 domain, member 5 n=1 Tax=Rhizophlyctis rosea TaxID=64517 RepID=A0AAD5S4C0_9FUNG|nr:TBC1 domain, member 5 [Rhizophlyctis rosea]
MRTVEDVRHGWAKFFGDPLLSPETVKARGITGSITNRDLRSLYWKIYLEYLPFSTDAWPLILAKERQGYEDLKKKYIFDPNKASEAANDWTTNNPLSLSEDSPWTQYFKDQELQKIIRQDVERTFPDQPMFRLPEIQDVMTDILFVWCKLNPDISYRQGMHELLAVVLFVVEFDKLDPTTDPSGLDPVAQAVFEAKFVEHDSAVLFYRIMRATKPWFEVPQDAAVSRVPRGVRGSKYQENRDTVEAVKPVPIVALCRRVQNEYLRVLDFELHQNLNKHGIEPQLYGLRWLRTLFGREFPIPELFSLWDGIFAEDPNLGLAEWVCVALLMFLRKDLVGNDYAMTMHRLMKFPPMDQLGTTVPNFIDSARGLRQRYAHRASMLAATNSPQRTPQYPAATVTRMESPPRTKRTNVPWLHHTNSVTSIPQPQPPATPERRASDTTRNYAPKVDTSSPRRISASSGSASPSTSNPSLASHDPSRDTTQTPNAVQLQLAHLTKQIQGVRERDRALTKKVDRCVSLIQNLIGGEEAKGLSPGIADVLEGVVAELTAVAGELRPQVPTVGGGGSEGRPSPTRSMSCKSISSPSLEGPPAVPEPQRVEAEVGSESGKREDGNEPVAVGKPTQGAVKDSVKEDVSSDSKRQEPNSLDANTTSAAPPPPQSESEVPNSDIQAKQTGPARWGSSVEIRNSPGIPIDIVPPTPPVQSSPPKEPRNDAAPIRARSATPDPWQVESSARNAEIPETGINVFEDPWAEHGQGGGAGAGFGIGSVRQMGSSAEIRHGGGRVDDEDEDEEESLARAPPSVSAGLGHQVSSKGISAVPAVSPARVPTSPVSPVTPTRLDLSRDPLNAGKGVGVVISPRSSVTTDPLGTL